MARVRFGFLFVCAQLVFTVWGQVASAYYDTCIQNGVTTCREWDQSPTYEVLTRVYYDPANSTPQFRAWTVMCEVRFEFPPGSSNPGPNPWQQYGAASCFEMLDASSAGNSAGPNSGDGGGGNSGGSGGAGGSGVGGGGASGGCNGGNCCSAGGGGGSGGSGGGSAGYSFAGSVINPTDHSLGESVAIVGTPFDLVYRSNRDTAYQWNYRLSIPVTGSTLPSGLLGSTVEIKVAGRTVTQTFYPAAANTTYQFLWDGLDASSQPVAGIVPVEVKLMADYGPGVTDYPRVENMYLGGYDGRSVGLGGWTLSVHHHFDVLSNKIQFGDGGVYNVVPKTLSSGNIWAPNQDGSLVFIFNSSGRHLETKNGLTGATLYTFGYTGTGLLSTVTDAYSNVTSITRNGVGEPTAIVSPYGKTTSLNVNANGLLTSVVSPGSATHSMTYWSSAGLLKTFTKPRGQVSTFNYDAYGRLTSDVNSAGNSYTLNNTFPPFEQGYRESTLTTAEGRQTTMKSYSSPSFSKTNLTFPDTSTLEMTSSVGSIFTSTEPHRSTQITPSEDIRFGTKVYRDGNRADNQGSVNRTSLFEQEIDWVTPSAPDIFQFNWLKNKTTTNSKLTTSKYTSSTGETETTTPVGRKSYAITDAQGKLTSYKWATFGATTYGYDSNGRLQTIQQGTRSGSLTYDLSGRVATYTDPESRVYQYGYDADNRLTSTTLPDLRVVAYNYDANDNLTSVTPPSKPAHTFGQNNFDLPSDYTAPTVSGTTQTTYAYNNDKQLTQIVRPGGATLTFNYDATAGTLSSITTPSGNFTYYYLPSQRPNYVAAPNGNINMLGYEGDFVNSESFYVNGGVTYLGVNTSVINSDFRTSSVTVNDSGSGTATYNMTYDNDGLLTQAGSLVITRNSTTGFISSTTLSRIGTTATYHSTYAEPATFTATYTPSGGSPSTLFSQTYTRDGLGRITTKVETIGGVTSTYVYTYNTAGALTTVTKDGLAYASYGYDTNLNRTSATVAGSSVSATYDNQDRISTYGTYTFTHTAPGEWLTRVNSSPAGTTTYAYDSVGNLVSVQRPGSVALITYETDGFNRRVRKKTGSTISKQWTYYDQLRIAAEFNSSGAVVSRFIYGTKSNVPDYMVRSGTTYRIISDHLGSVRLVVNASNGTISQRLDYDEFGRVLTDTSPGFQPFGFAGGLYDSDTKLVRFGARDYDSETGRWLAKDPILFNGGDTNLYGYVMSDPVNWIDPNGRYTVCLQLYFGGPVQCYQFSDPNRSVFEPIRTPDRIRDTPDCLLGGLLCVYPKDDHLKTRCSTSDSNYESSTTAPDTSTRMIGPF